MPASMLFQHVSEDQEGLPLELTQVMAVSAVVILTAVGIWALGQWKPTRPYDGGCLRR